LNTSKPLAGSAEATTTLTAEGTLGSASSKEESKTFATVASLLPVSELAKSIPAAAYIVAPPKIYSFQIATKAEFYRHTHSAPTDAPPPCTVPSDRDDIVETPANVTVEHIGDLVASPAPAADAPKPDTPKKP
jgi:hypothetical protein